MTGPDLLSHSTAFLRGLRAGHRQAGSSLTRRFLLHLVLAAVLYGGALGLLWATWDTYLQAADHLLTLRAVEGSPITVIGKIAAWNYVYEAPKGK